MPPKRHLTARRVRLGSELRKLREATGMKAREAAALLGADSVQMSQIESGVAGVSAARVRRLAAHYACADEGLIEALAAMATDRTRGWWEEYRGVLPPVFLDTAEVEHHAALLHEVVITHVPGLLQTADYARAVYSYMAPGLPESELNPRVEHRMRRRTVIDGSSPAPYETLIHEFALRLRVADRGVARAQLRQILEQSEQDHVTVRVIPTDQDGFAGAGASMMYAGGPVPQLDTGLRDAPTGTMFIDVEPRLKQLRTLFRKVKEASLEPIASRDFIHRLSKEV
ncbi:helix-turn-helix domain-containing protein [Streptomyces europaeiscabiei]|uniref:Helix-turn-helix transcriptional regulator n=1 Tax=Streptomyces europaeiscabiei TaxID=146819 RepID=A0ABU4NPG8_9ACTN|nr:helix-turn-helix transcriptional regulator [Streptomyces europaeiscabiei]MDX2522935.1 helix-turn-helix transcriptional regulator [Streptomyces europaeiscabiei]MDX3547163.1 helix-turn-helix transcriptional regulator [Streptomyces europaeiscabiei]MDX3556916.1 helix-turn-helix transcriptional regulator [Streptomyces europaeiscabiei]MDX3671218.1 helix-turn-helix transcriptional regulator [Streptomyces europaeiscabiei]MDX3704572.1 helix-turn-helix transcriptional regulator [Streptomyces europaei